MKRFIQSAMLGLALVSSPWVHGATVSLGGGGGAANFTSGGGCSAIAGPAATVAGCISSNISVLLGGAGEHLVLPSNGQARVEASDGGFSALAISLASPYAFGQLILNINAAANGQVTFSSPGISFTTSTVNVGQNGQNFITVTAGPGEVFTSLSLTSNVSIEDIRQLRFDEVAAVPLPAAVWLLATGILGLFGFGRRHARTPG